MIETPYLRPKVLMIAIVTTGLISCSPGKVFKSGSNETKPGAIQLLSRNATSEESSPIMVARYRVSVSSVKAKWDNLCSGVVTVSIYGDFKMKPAGEIKCDLGPTIDASMLAKDFNIEKEQLDPKTLPQAGYIVRKPNPAAGAPGPSFAPRWPASLGPIVQDHTIFDGYQYGESCIVGGTTYDGSQQLRDSGSWKITVNEINGSYTSEENPELVYDNIIQWSLVTQNFGLAPKSETGIFDRQEYWYNTRPIAIPKIIMEAELKDLMPPGQMPPMMETLGQLFVGKLQIKLTIMDESRL